jgi:hypothetical protein
VGVKKSEAKVELDGRAEVVRLSDAQASEAVLDPAKGLRLICDAIERTMAKNQGRPRSAALLAASIDNMQSVRDLFGPSTRRTIFTPPDRAWRKYVWSARSIGRENIGYPVDGV